MQTFRTLREQNCYYVDKTPYVQRLLDEGTHYFLSRPRRFGKSLFLDTLKELFEGSEELVAGTATSTTGHNWSERHPVVRLSFGGGNFRNSDLLEANVMEQLAAAERRLGVVSKYLTAAGRFAYLLEALHRQTGQRVAVLVDEYDKPILDVLEQPQVARANRDYLRGLYGVIKDSDAHVRFTFLTGISKFSKVNLFSQLNNLTDITLDPAYSSICGYTEDDLEAVFAPELGGLDREQVRDWYNGYSWRGAEKVYNPFDVLLLLRRREFEAHWFETGTPAFLVDMLFERRVSSVSLGDMVSTGELLSAFDVGGRAAAEHIGTEALLFQTGYLTITGEERLGGKALFRLGYPNREVRQSLNEHLLRHLVQDAGQQTANSIAWRACWRRMTAPASRSCSTPSSPAFPIRGMPPDGVGGPTTTSATSRASTRACSTLTSLRSATTSRWRSRAATGAWTWRCAPPATSTCSSSRWWRCRRRERRSRSCRNAATPTSTAPAASRST